MLFDIAAMEIVCSEILDILKTRREQMDAGDYSGTPGGLEHMGDVWSLFLTWERILAGDK